MQLSMSKSNKLALEALEKVARGTGGKDQTQWLSQCLRVRLEITANLSGDLKQGSGLVHKHPGAVFHVNYWSRVFESVQSFFHFASHLTLLLSCICENTTYCFCLQ